MVAAGVIRRFCPPGGQVVDFCSGYGGRLLAAITCGVSYIGIDVSGEQIEGSRRMAVDLQNVTTQPVVLSQGSATDLLDRVELRSADLVFTSPPYFDRERYGEDEWQSCVQFSSYERWLNGFLEPAIRHSFAVLKTNAHLVLNVADNRRFRLAEDTSAILKKIFGNLTIHNMRMRRLPSYNHFDSAHRSEQILISSKMASGTRRPGSSKRGPAR
jgi:tRNA G10  N-methylase Trm11